MHTEKAQAIKKVTVSKVIHYLVKSKSVTIGFLQVLEDCNK